MKRQFWVSATGWLLFLGGSAMMSGWLLRFPVWEFISPTGTVMVFQTALCFALAGIGLSAPQALPGHARQIRIAMGCAMMTISGLMLAQAALSSDFGIDLATLHRWYPDQNPHPGRMAPNTAIAFLMGGAAFVIGATGKKTGILSHALPAAILTLGLLGLAGYTFLFDLAYDWYDVPRMAASTAAGMIALGVGLIAELKIHSAVDSAVADGAVESRGYAFLGAAITILAMIAFLSYGSIRALVSRAAWVEHTGEVRTQFESLIAVDARAYSAWRTFYANGDRDSLAEHRVAAGELPERLAHLQRLTAGNPAQQERLAAMRALMEENAAALAHSIAIQEGGGRESREEMLARRSLLKLNRNQLDSLSAAFRAEESRLLAQRKEESQRSVATTIAVILAGNALGFASLIYAAWLLKRQSDQRSRLAGALQDSNTFLDSLVEHIPNMVFVKDAGHLRFVRFNKAGEELLGFPRAEMLGKNDYDFFPREEADSFTARDRAVLAGNAIVDITEEPIHTRDKGVRILHTMKIPIADAQGRPQYLLGISEDITERKQAEQEIVALNASLKARAAELEASNKELESFTYSVSHDLRAPLRAINGYALMLEEDCQKHLDGAGKRYIAQIRGYSSQMGALIDDLLRLSRLGRQDLKTVAVDMNELLRDVLRTELATWHGQLPKIEIAALPRVAADPLLLRQAWANLISNALKYSGKKADARIEISGHETHDESVYWVKDNGVGFDMTYYDKLFGVFQRLHRADEFPGTGVGLAIVHRVVTRHGGRVWAEGRPNEGATFFLALPSMGSDR